MIHMLTERQRLRLIRLLEIASRRRLSFRQQWEVNYLSQKAGLRPPYPPPPGVRRPARVRALPPIDRTLPPQQAIPPVIREVIYGPPLPPPVIPVLYPEPSIEGGFFVYRRLLEFRYLSGPRYRSVPIHSRVRLSIDQLEAMFRERAEEIARYASFGGIMAYVNPWEVGRPTPAGYVPAYGTGLPDFGFNLDFDFDLDEFPDFEPKECEGT